jgi:hypothetical protein
MSQCSTENVVIIGAGIAGVSAALKLSAYTKVTLIEKKQLFSGASGKNPGRMGLGFHYYDLDTAKMYLYASVQVQKAYPSFLIGQDLPFEHPIRHGRYFITKTSNFSFNDVLKIYRALQEEYRSLVTQDASNMVFGHPDEFIKILSCEDYFHQINHELVEGGVETCEHLFDWPKFKSYIYEQLKKNPNITFLENAEVLDIQYHQSLDYRYTILFDHNTSKIRELKSISSNFIINSAWENIEYLNSKLGITYVNGTRSNRLKCLLEVSLPDSLRDTHSAFFCMGSFCMFSNMGNGRGMMTLAEVTNMDVSNTLKVNKTIEYYLSEEVTIEDKMKFGLEILKGVSIYIPDMINAKIIDVKFGIVQTLGNLQLEHLSSLHSAHHKRNYNGIREEQQGLISNPAMKLFYFIENSLQVEKLFHTQLLREEKVRKILGELNQLPKQQLKFDIRKAYQVHLDRWVMSYSDISLIDHRYFLSLIEQRHHLIQKLNREILLWEHIKLRVNRNAEWVQPNDGDSVLEFGHVYHSLRNIVKKTSPKLSSLQANKDPIPGLVLADSRDDEKPKVKMVTMSSVNSFDDSSLLSNSSIFRPIVSSPYSGKFEEKDYSSSSCSWVDFAENNSQTVSYDYGLLKSRDESDFNIFDEEELMHAWQQLAPSKDYCSTDRRCNSITLTKFSSFRMAETVSSINISFNAPKRPRSACSHIARQDNYKTGLLLITPGR